MRTILRDDDINARHNDFEPQSYCSTHLDALHSWISGDRWSGNRERRSSLPRRDDRLQANWRRCMGQTVRASSSRRRRQQCHSSVPAVARKVPAQSEFSLVFSISKEPRQGRGSSHSALQSEQVIGRICSRPAGTRHSADPGRSSATPQERRGTSSRRAEHSATNNVHPRRR